MQRVKDAAARSKLIHLMMNRIWRNLDYNNNNNNRNKNKRLLFAVYVCVCVLFAYESINVSATGLGNSNFDDFDNRRFGKYFLMR